MKCNTEGCDITIHEGDDHCEGCEWQAMEDHLDSLIHFMKIEGISVRVVPLPMMGVGVNNV